MKNIKNKTNPGKTSKKSKSSVKMISLKIDKKNLPQYLIKVAILAIVLGALYYFRGQFIVATVNNRPISRIALVKELETQAGKRTLDSLIINALVLQEGKKQGIVLTDEQIAIEIEAISQNLSAQGQSLEVALAAQGMTRQGLEKQILIQKTAEGIVKDNIEITDEEVDQYIEENKEYIPTDMSEEEVINSSKQQLEQQKMNTEIQTLIEKLQKEANINHLLYKN